MLNNIRKNVNYSLFINLIVFRLGVYIYSTLLYIYIIPIYYQIPLYTSNGGLLITLAIYRVFQHD